jgi:hypothetical protein
VQEGARRHGWSAWRSVETFRNGIVWKQVKMSGNRGVTPSVSSEAKGIDSKEARRKGKVGRTEVKSNAFRWSPGPGRAGVREKS